MTSPIAACSLPASSVSAPSSPPIWRGPAPTSRSPSTDRAAEADATAGDQRPRPTRLRDPCRPRRSADACRRLVDDAADALGRLDVLINMASVYVAKPYDALTDADWDAAINVDLRASHLCTQAAVPHMRRQGGGRVINFSDWISASGRPRYTDTCHTTSRRPA